MRELILPVIGLLILSSCSTPRYSYVPSRVNAPSLQEKGEVQLNGSIAALNGFDASAAYAVTSHLGIILNANWRNDREKGSEFYLNELLPPDQINYHRTSVDLGVGWFTKLDQSVYMEIYGGFGMGRFSIEDSGKILDAVRIPYSRFYDARVRRFFLQPGFSAGSPSLQFVFFLRFQFQNYAGINTNYTTREMEYYSIPYNSKMFYGFLEPGCSFRYYIKALPAIGFEVNMLFSRAILNSNSIDWVFAHMSAGLQLRLQKSRSKTRPS